MGSKARKSKKPDLLLDEERLDEIGAESFPASDPPPWPVTHPGAPGSPDETPPRAGRHQAGTRHGSGGAKTAAD